MHHTTPTFCGVRSCPSTRTDGRLNLLFLPAALEKERPTKGIRAGLRYMTGSQNIRELRECTKINFRFLIRLYFNVDHRTINVCLCVRSVSHTR